MDISHKLHRIILLTIFLIKTLDLYTQNPEFLRAEQHGANPKVIRNDTKGNVYIADLQSGTNDFDPGNGIFNLSAESVEMLSMQCRQQSKPL